MSYNRFQIGCVFVEYDQFNTTNIIQNLTYVRRTFWYNFDTVLYQFIETGTPERNLIFSINS